MANFIEPTQLPALPRYVAGTVRALRISRVDQAPRDVATRNDGDWRLTFADEGFQPFDVPHSWYVRYRPEPGGYFIVYDGGNTSYMSQGNFDSAYVSVGQITKAERIATLSHLVAQAPDISDALLSQPDPWQRRSAGMKCSSCIWYAEKKSATSDVTIGRCRRHAPTMIGYPVVYPTDWCGDHKLDENKA